MFSEIGYHKYLYYNLVSWGGGDGVKNDFYLLFKFLVLWKGNRFNYLSLMIRYHGEDYYNLSSLREVT